MRTTLETSEDENHTRNEWRWEPHSKRVKMRTTLEKSEDVNYTRNEWRWARNEWTEPLTILVAMFRAWKKLVWAGSRPTIGLLTRFECSFTSGTSGDKDITLSDNTSTGRGGNLTTLVSSEVVKLHSFRVKLSNYTRFEWSCQITLVSSEVALCCIISFLISLISDKQKMNPMLPRMAFNSSDMFFSGCS